MNDRDVIKEEGGASLNACSLLSSEAPEMFEKTKTIQV